MHHYIILHIHVPGYMFLTMHDEYQIIHEIYLLIKQFFWILLNMKTKYGFCKKKSESEKTFLTIVALTFWFSMSLEQKLCKFWIALSMQNTKFIPI